MVNDVLSRMYASDRPTTAVHIVSPIFKDRFHEAQITSEHLSALLVWVAGSPLVLLVSWLVVGAGFATGVATLMLALPLGFVVIRSDRRSRQVIALLPDAIEMIGRSLRSGATLRGALGELLQNAPDVIADEVRPIVNALERGRPLEAALREWISSSALPEVRVVASALALASSHEAGTSQTLDGIAQSLRDRAALSAEIKALTSQASTSMQALVALPAGFLAIDAIGGMRVLSYLLYEPFGQICLVAGIALDGCGWVWMRALTRRRSNS